MTCMVLLVLPLLLLLHGALGADTVADLTARGDSLRARGKLNDALVEYSKAVRQDPSNYLLLFKRGAVYMGMDGKELAAISDFGKVLSIKPGFEGALLQRSKLQLKLGRFELAKIDAELVKKGGKSVLDKIDLAIEKLASAKTALEKEEFEECEQLASEGLKVSKGNPQLRHIRAQCSLQKGNIRGALTDFNSLEFYGSKQERFEAYVMSARLYYYVFHEYDTALSHLQKCLRYDMDNKECKNAHTELRRIEKKSGGQYSGLPNASKNYAASDKIWSAVISLTKGSAIESLKSEVKQAYKDLGLLRLDPETHSSLLIGLEESICVAFYNNKKYSDTQAIFYCDKVISREHANSPSINAEITAHLLKVEGLLQDNDDFDGAIAELHRAMQVHTDNEQLKSKMHQIQVQSTQAKTKDYYKVLDVSRTADDREIRSAYREKSRQYHPDKYKGDMTPEQVDRKMSEVNEAYEVLSSPELRARFDRGDDPNSTGGGGGGGFHQGGSPYQQQFRGNPYQGGANHEQMFNMFFRQHQQQQQQQQQRQGQRRQNGKRKPPPRRYYANAF